MPSYSMRTQRALSRTRIAGAMNSTWARVLLPSLIILLIGLWLDFSVDLDACEYDACRYIRLTYPEYLATFDAAFFSSTTLMHFLYGGLGNDGAPFLKIACCQAIFFSALVLLFDVTNPVMRSPLFIALLAIPGKEFFLLISMLLVFPDSNDVVRRRAWALRLLLAVILVCLSRLPYVAIFSFTYGLAYIYRHKGKGVFWGYALVGWLVLAGLMMLIGMNEGVKEISEQEATVDGVNYLRDYTFGFSLGADFFRFLVYVGYLIFLPIAEIIRAMIEIPLGNFYPAQPFLWAAVLEWMAYVFWRSKSLALAGLLISALMVAVTFPFIHTRYLLPVLLFVQAFAFGRSNLKPFGIWR